MTHDTHPTTPHTHTHTPPPYLGGCEEDLSNGRKGLLHRGHTYIHTDGHCDSMTESAQLADSVKRSKEVLTNYVQRKNRSWEVEKVLFSIPGHYHIVI